jgi:hypothetical protein
MILTIYSCAIQGFFVRISKGKVGHAVVILWFHSLFAVVTLHQLRPHSQFGWLLVSGLCIPLCAGESG